MAGEVERDRKRGGGEESTSVRRYTHCAPGEKTITEGHYQMRFVKLPGISSPFTPHLHASLFTSFLLTPFFSSFLFSLFLDFNDNSWWVGPAWDGQRRTILLAINLRL